MSASVPASVHYMDDDLDDSDLCQAMDMISERWMNRPQEDNQHQYQPHDACFTPPHPQSTEQYGTDATMLPMLPFEEEHKDTMEEEVDLDENDEDEVEEEDDEDEDDGDARGQISMGQELAGIEVEQELFQLTQQQPNLPPPTQRQQRAGDPALELYDEEEDDEDGDESDDDEDEPMEDRSIEAADDDEKEEEDDQDEKEEEDDWMFRNESISHHSQPTGEVLDELARNRESSTVSTNSTLISAAPVPASQSRRILPPPSWFAGDPSYPPQSLAHYVPSFLAAAYASEMKIQELFAWQVECLQQSDAHALQHGNLVYSAPTSGGKTLVAELLLFRYILKYNVYRSRCAELQQSPHSSLSTSSASAPSSLVTLPSVLRALFIVPFNALVQEKARDLQAIVRIMYQQLQHNVQQSPSSHILPDDDAPKIHVKPIDHVSDFSADSHILIGVVTIEKAGMIINQMIKEKRTNEIGCVIIDVSHPDSMNNHTQFLMNAERTLSCIDSYSAMGLQFGKDHNMLLSNRCAHECHLLGDPSRGFLLEILLTKLRVADLHRRIPTTSIRHNLMEDEKETHSPIHPSTTAGTDVSFSLPPLQIIALSATLPNIKHLCECLNAKFYETNFRPVELSEKYTIQANLPNTQNLALTFYDSQGGLKGNRFPRALFNLLRTPKTDFYDPTLIGYLCADTISHQKNAIVFCSSKQSCMTHASLIARVVKRILLEMIREENKEEFMKRQGDLLKKRHELLTQLQQISINVDPVLKFSIPFGIAFHHAGLTFAERDVIEIGYRLGALSILCATTTLACGVNLGASRVIFTSLKTGREQMDVATYRQCAGRAGRAGKDESGESIILLSEDYWGRPIDWVKHVRACQTIMTAPMPNLVSCLDQIESNHNITTMQQNRSPSNYSPYLCRLLLDSICSNLVVCERDIDYLLQQTLLFQQKKPEHIQMMKRQSVEWMIAHEFIRAEVISKDQTASIPPSDQRPSHIFRATPLGHATMVSTLAPHEALVIHSHLSMAREQLILDGKLHLLFLITPLKVNFAIDYEKYQSMLGSLTASQATVAHLLHIDQGRLIAWSANPPDRAYEQTPQYQIYKRFYSSLILLEYIQWENSLWEDYEPNQPRRTFQIDPKRRGEYHQLYESTQSYGHVIALFCAELQWHELSWMIKQYATEELTQCETEIIQQGNSSRPGSTRTKSGIASRPLAELQHIRPSILATLYNANLTTVKKIHEAPPEDISSILRKSRMKSTMNSESDVDIEDAVREQVERVKRAALEALNRNREAMAQRNDLLRIQQQRLEQLKLSDPSKAKEANSNQIPSSQNPHKRLKRSDAPMNASSSDRAMTDITNTVHSTSVANLVTPAKPGPPRGFITSNTSSPGNAGFSQYPSSYLMDQLRSPNNMKNTQTTSPSPRNNVDCPTTMNLPIRLQQPESKENANPAQAASTPTTKNLSDLSHDEWCSFKTRWLTTTRHMYWQFFGIRRTKQEHKQRSRVMDALEAEGQDEMKIEGEDDDDDIALTPAEEVDLLLSPHCRTFFLPAHSSHYPLTLRSIEGIAIQLDTGELEKDPITYQLRVGEQFNSTNELGASGLEMWETFLTALLNPKITSISINMKTNFEILMSLPMPRHLIHKIYEQANQRLQQQSNTRTKQEDVKSRQHTLLPPDSPTDTSFLTLYSLISSTSNPLPLVDLRVAHWLLMPTDSNLQELEAYYAWYTRTGDSHANRYLVEAIPDAPDRAGKTKDKKDTYNQQDHLINQRTMIMKRNPYAPVPPASVQTTLAKWEKVTPDRFRYPTNFQAATRLIQMMPALYVKLLQYLTNLSLHRAFRDIELPLIPVLAHMEYWGMRFQKAEFQWHLDRMQERFQYLEHAARLLVDQNLDLQSPRQYLPIVEKALKKANLVLPRWFQMKAKGPLKGVPKLLTELAPIHPLPKFILEYHQLSYALSHLLTLPSKAAKHPVFQHDRMHPTLLNATETGRLSCQEPNVQSIPRESNYTTSPRYSVHEELALGRLSAEPAQGVRPANIHVHLSSNEKRVELEQRRALAAELQKQEAIIRKSPQVKKKIGELKHEQSIDRRLHCLVMAPEGTGEIQYGVIRDIRAETIQERPVQFKDQATSSSATPTTVITDLHVVPLADWWERRSQGRLRWSPVARSTVRQVLVELAGCSRLPFPADLVWRHQAFVLPEQAEQVQTEPVIIPTPSQLANLPNPVHAASSSCTTRVPIPRSMRVLTKFSVRNCFIASPGYTLLSADYSNIELRIMAHFSKDTNLLEMFRNSVDVLTAMASRLNNNIPIESVTPEQRQLAKSCVYGVLYGAGIERIAEQNNLTTTDAEHFYKCFKALFKGVTEFGEKMIEQVRKDGFVTTLFQRKRWLRVVDPNPQTRASERRKVTNTLCQGSAADLIKAAMARIMYAIACYRPAVKYDEPARLIMQMHDELLFEVKQEDLHAMKVRCKKSLIEQRMEFQDAGFQLRVPLVVRIKVGHRWGSMIPWNDYLQAQQQQQPRQ